MCQFYAMTIIEYELDYFYSYKHLIYAISTL